MFIDGALPGELARVRVRGKRRSHLDAVLVEILRQGPDRVDPPCPYFGTCGGCALQHLAHQAQLEAKHQQLSDALRRIGKITPEHWLTPISGPIWEYRRKARLGVRYVPKKGGVLVGFRERHKSYITPLKSCAALAPQVSKLLPTLPELIAGLSCYTRIPQIEVAVGDNDVALVLRHLEPLTDVDVAKIQDYARSHHIQMLLQAEGPNSIVACWPAVFRELYYTLPKHNIVISFGPTDFVQVNAKTNHTLIDLALELLEPAKQERLLDLFCGLGNFTLPIARYCNEVIGVEGDPELVQRAQHNAEQNHLTNVKFIHADLYTESGDLALPDALLLRKPNKILLDPPRSGAIEIIKKIPELAPQRIVYVSCNPATLARDSELLVHKHRYRLTRAGIIDMFPNTAHVESIAVFERTGT